MTDQLKNEEKDQKMQPLNVDVDPINVDDFSKGRGAYSIKFKHDDYFYWHHPRWTSKGLKNLKWSYRQSPRKVTVLEYLEQTPVSLCCKGMMTEFLVNTDLSPQQLLLVQPGLLGDWKSEDGKTHIPHIKNDLFDAPVVQHKPRVLSQSSSLISSTPSSSSSSSSSSSASIAPLEYAYEADYVDFLVEVDETTNQAVIMEIDEVFAVGQTQPRILIAPPNLKSVKPAFGTPTFGVFTSIHDLIAARVRLYIFSKLQELHKKQQEGEQDGDIKAMNYIFISDIVRIFGDSKIVVNTAKSTLNEYARSKRVNRSIIDSSCYSLPSSDRDIFISGCLAALLIRDVTPIVLAYASSPFCIESSSSQYDKLNDSQKKEGFYPVDNPDLYNLKHLPDEYELQLIFSLADYCVLESTFHSLFLLHQSGITKWKTVTNYITNVPNWHQLEQPLKAKAEDIERKLAFTTWERCRAWKGHKNTVLSALMIQGDWLAPSIPPLPKHTTYRGYNKGGKGKAKREKSNPDDEELSEEDDEKKQFGYRSQRVGIRIWNPEGKDDPTKKSEADLRHLSMERMMEICTTILGASESEVPAKRFPRLDFLRTRATEIHRRTGRKDVLKWVRALPQRTNETWAQHVRKLYDAFLRHCSLLAQTAFKHDKKSPLSKLSMGFSVTVSSQHVTSLPASTIWNNLKSHASTMRRLLTNTMNSNEQELELVKQQERLVEFRQLSSSSSFSPSSSKKILRLEKRRIQLDGTPSTNYEYIMDKALIDIFMAGGENAFFAEMDRKSKGKHKSAEEMQDDTEDELSSKKRSEKEKEKIPPSKKRKRSEKENESSSSSDGGEDEEKDVANSKKRRVEKAEKPKGHQISESFKKLLKKRKERQNQNKKGKKKEEKKKERVCKACGRPGHMKTNRLCEMYYMTISDPSIMKLGHKKKRLEEEFISHVEAALTQNEAEEEEKNKPKEKNSYGWELRDAATEAETVYLPDLSSHSIEKLNAPISSSSLPPSSPSPPSSSITTTTIIKTVETKITTTTTRTTEKPKRAKSEKEKKLKQQNSQQEQKMKQPPSASSSSLPKTCLDSPASSSLTLSSLALSIKSNDEEQDPWEIAAMVLASLDD